MESGIKKTGSQRATMQMWIIFGTICSINQIAEVEKF